MVEVVRIRVECPRVVERVRSHDKRVPSTRISPRVTLRFGTEFQWSRTWDRAGARTLARKLRSRPGALQAHVDRSLPLASPAEAARLAAALERAVEFLRARPPRVAVKHRVGRTTATSRLGTHRFTVIVEGSVVARGAWYIGFEVGGARTDDITDSWWFSALFVARMADALDRSGPTRLPPERQDVIVRREREAVRLRLHDEIVRDSGFDGWFTMSHRSASSLAQLLRKALAISRSHPPLVDRYRKDVIADTAIRGPRT